jgi:Na+/H+ antiporter NhaD/arsenite permease-like protein/mannitol/fructose-specific phosphotransferase system IIA component (Ntr-type)
MPVSDGPVTQDKGIRLSDYIEPSLVIDLPRLDSAAELFQLVGQRLAAAGLVTDPELVVRELTARESSGSTGVGEGIALPHAIVAGAVTRLTMALVRVRRPVEWQSIDHQPVSLFVVIVAPPEDRPLYLKVLAEVARVLSQAPARRAILGARTPRRVLTILDHGPGTGFLTRARPIIVLAAAVLATWLLAHFLLPHVRLPDTGVYRELDIARFNAEPWLSRQALTTALFLGLVLGTLLFWRFRVAIAAVCLGVLLLLGVMDIEHAVHYMSLPTVIFIMAMMVLIKWLEDLGVFRFIVLKVVSRVGQSPVVLLVVLMMFSVLISGFAGEVSGILVTLGLAIEIARRTKTPVLPYLLSLVFATNVGSALTLVGNPIGIYIAFSGGLTFETFLRWATPLAAVAGIVIAVTCVLLFRARLKPKAEVGLSEAELSDSAANPQGLRLGFAVFGVIVLMIVLHARAETLLHLREGTLLMAVPLAALAFVVFSEQERGRQMIARGIDWWTVLFFMFLFANAACLEYTGVTTKMGYLLLETAQRLPITRWLGESGLTASTLILMLWGSGIGSGFIDNMPIVATLVPIVKNLGAVGLPHSSILWWSLLFGGCLGGNMTMIGSSANLVAIGVYEKATGQQIKFREWIVTGTIVTVVSLAIATAGLLIQIPFAR